ncbi:MAG: SMP-30/gluconolactonase/LRE family protein [Bacillota bacterium]|nr:SMP-30/gluconolactonase/LRE family protein [Bacillota bacterium]MDW7685316.1 SMP-30/gluconolactonase/LRE family protein [Bacillota bacterium]
MKTKKFIALILVLIIIIVTIFLYLFLTRNPLLWDLPIFPKSQTAPIFLYSFGDKSGPGELSQPMAAVSDGIGNVHVSDFERGEVIVFSREGAYMFAYGNNNVAEDLKLKSPYGLAEYNSRIYVADTASRRILIFNSRGDFQDVLLASSEDAAHGIFIPTALTANPQNGNIYIADVFQHRILAVDQEGNYLFELPGSVSGVNLSYPNGVALDSKGNIYVADSNNARIVVFSSEGDRVLWKTEGDQNGETRLSVPRGLALDTRDNLWLADVLTHQVSMFNGTNFGLQFGGMGLQEGELYFPNDVVIHQNGNFYVLESGQGRVSVFGSKASIVK